MYLYAYIYIYKYTYIYIQLCEYKVMVKWSTILKSYSDAMLWCAVNHNTYFRLFCCFFLTLIL